MTRRTVPNACPDDGACHHQCGAGPCFRVLYCAPLGREQWTEAETRAALDAAPVGEPTATGMIDRLVREDAP